MADPIQDSQTESAEQRYARLYPGQQSQTQPSATQPTAPQEPQPDLAAVLNELKSELSGLKEHVQRQPSQQNPPPAPPPVPSDDEWLQALGKGDVKGARKILAAQLRQELQEDFQQLRQEANTQTEAQIQMATYRDQVRAANADLLEFEPYLAAPVQQRMNEAQQAGKIRTHTDFVTQYKAALDAEVAKIRTLSQKFRASGRDEAQTRSRQVLDSSTLQPQLVQSLQPNQPDGQEPPVETTQDYFARRQAEGRRMRGLT